MKKKASLIEGWTQGPIEKRKILAYLDRMPLNIPLSEAMKSLPPLLRISQDMASEARDYLHLITNMIPKKVSDVGLENEVQELLREIPKAVPTFENQEQIKWNWQMLVTPSMAGCLGIAVAMYFVLKWVV